MKYLDAKEIIDKTAYAYNICNEYDEGFHFLKDEDNDVVGDNGYVVIKKTGEIANWITFIIKYKPAKEIINTWKINL